MVAPRLLPGAVAVVVVEAQVPIIPTTPAHLARRTLAEEEVVAGSTYQALADQEEAVLSLSAIFLSL